MVQGLPEPLHGFNMPLPAHMLTVFYGQLPKVSGGDGLHGWTDGGGGKSLCAAVNTHSLVCYTTTPCGVAWHSKVVATLWVGSVA
jgi:hypothetical protein